MFDVDWVLVVVDVDDLLVTGGKKFPNIPTCWRYFFIAESTSTDPHPIIQFMNEL